VQRALFPNIVAESVMTIKPGKNADGYWTNSDLVAQLKNVIQIVQVLHPYSGSVFMFDNSQNHRSLPPDALNPNVLPIKDGGKNVKSQRDGWFMLNGEIFVQQMRNSEDKPNGLRAILMERGLWDYTLSRKPAQQLLQQQAIFKNNNAG
jgi:hypothetical protein